MGTLKSKTAPDSELIRRAREGDDGAFAELFKKFNGLALDAAQKVIGRHATSGAAWDVVLVAWGKCHKTLAGFNLARPFAPWLLTIVRYAAIDYLRSFHCRAKYTARLCAEPRAQHAEGNPGRSIDFELALGLLERLEPKEREATKLALVDHMTQTEIAAELALPLGTVKSLIRRGIQKMRENLDDLARQLPPNVVRFVQAAA